MSVETVALGGGILFLLVAIVGGGFAIREISLPRVPNWARAVAGICGLLLLVPFALTILRGGVAADVTRPARSDPEHQQPEQERQGIEIDTEPATTGDQIRLTGLTASVRNTPPRVGDTIAVTYSLTNVGKQPIQLEYTFVGARNPAGDNKDSEDENEGRSLGPGETIQAAGRIFVDEAGPWLLWPCYLLPGDQFCPDEWKAFNITAVV